MGMYFGWVMTRRSVHFKRLALWTVVSGLWAMDLWTNFVSDTVPLRIYKDQGYVQIMVFLLLASAFTAQSICLAAGTRAAYCRKRELSIVDDAI